MSQRKISPRQKMINLMYLIFIAMMVMNVDREVLKSFDYTNQSLQRTAEKMGESNELFYENIKKKAAKDPEKYSNLYEKAFQIKKLSENFYQQIESLKNTLKKRAGLDEKSQSFDYRRMESSRYVDKFFFDAGKPNLQAQKFKNEMDNFRAHISSIYSNVNSKKRVNELFSTQADKKDSWLKNRFFSQPFIASLTNFSKIQMDIRNEEFQAVLSMLTGKLEEDMAVNQLEAMVFGPKILMRGEKAHTKIVLAIRDASLGMQVLVNGQNIAVKGGQALLEMNTDSSGEKSLTGSVSFTNEKGEKKIYPFSYTYQVIADKDQRYVENKIYEKPSGGIISADKMNVVYRGVDNPISGSIVGLASANLSMSASTGKLSKTGIAHWVYRPGKDNTVDFTLSGKTTTGTTVKQKLNFRIKELPAPQGSIRGETEPQMPASSLAKVSIGAQIPGFDFPVKLIVSDFTVKIPGQASIFCSGNRLNQRAQEALEKVRPGTTVIIGNINARLFDENILLKKVSPVAVYINN